MCFMCEKKSENFFVIHETNLNKSRLVYSSYVQSLPIRNDDKSWWFCSHWLPFNKLLWFFKIWNKNDKLFFELLLTLSAHFSKRIYLILNLRFIFSSWHFLSKRSHFCRDDKGNPSVDWNDWRHIIKHWRGLPMIIW